MPPNDDYPDHDSFEQALYEYRERSWCPDEFGELPTDVQRGIMERAIQIQKAEERMIQAA